MGTYIDFIKPHRPEYFTGRGDRYLPQIAEDLDDFIYEVGKDAWRVYTVGGQRREILSEILVEFAEDIHNNIGIWNAYENYNREFFGTPLPMMLPAGSEIDSRAITPERIAHLIWVLIPDLFYFPAISPGDPELLVMAKSISDFLNERFEKVPRDSGINQFLSIPVRNYYEVKKRLIWLGTESYLFRLHYENYLMDFGERPQIQVTDDFICSAVTPWSGLGVIDILAGLLDIPPARKTELRSWYERHFAVYRVKSKGKNSIEAINLINNVSYRVRTDINKTGFNPGDTVLGSLAPWNGEWYWSGLQRSLNGTPETEIQLFKRELAHRHPEIVFHYDKDLLEKAAILNSKQMDAFISHFGDSLVVFPDGKSFKQGIDDFYLKYIEKNTKDFEKIYKPKKTGLFRIEPELRRCKSGIGVYFDALSGMQIRTGFKVIESGFKKGDGLFLNEGRGIREFIQSNVTSPSFVRKMVEKYGDTSVSSAFGFKTTGHPVLEYFLRRYKGRYYRNVYPPITVVPEEPEQTVLHL